MRLTRWTASLLVLSSYANLATAQSSVQTAFNYYADEEAAVAPEADAEAAQEDSQEDEAVEESTGDCASGCESEEPSCDCQEPSCEAGDSCCEEAACGDEVACGDECGDACGGNGDLCSGWSMCNCCPGDPWLLQSYLQPCCDKSITYAGWMQMGYHTDNTGLSRARGDLLDTNDVPDDVNLQQLWFYTEKATEADACSADWGYRFDMLYGTDAQKTQAFGNTGAGTAGGPEGWDNGWDHGVYGWAMPQAYLEVAFGDWKVKGGHFYTPLGYEVFPATGNFFYSHALTFFNSEPFTHTGMLGTYSGLEGYTIYTGWTLGWDTGFDQFENGNNFVGGFTRTFSEDLSFTYLCTVGDLGFRSGDEFGYSHSMVGIATLSEKTQYVIQSDLVAADGLFGDDDTDNFDVGVNQYLFYTINDCYKLGGRFEWWKTDQLGESTSFFEITGGINYRPHANVVIRPEIRYDFVADEDVVDEDYDRDIFGVDAIFTF